MSNIHARDYKPPSTRFNLGRVSGFHDEKIIPDHTELVSNQKDSRTSLSKGADKSMSSSKDRLLRNKSKEHDKQGIMGGARKDHPADKNDAKANKAASSDKDKMVERESRQTHGLRDDTNKREGGAGYSKFGQPNGSVY